MAWESDSEEHLSPRLRLASWAVEAGEGEYLTRTSGPSAAAAIVPAEWADDGEGPIRGRLRRALLAVD